MHHPRRVQRQEALGELPERQPQPRRVEERRVQARARDLDRRRAPDGAHARSRGGRRLLDEQGGANVRDEVDPSDEVHGQEPPVVLADELAQGHEVGVLHLLHRAKLALQARQVFGARVPQRLERHPRSPLSVERLVDDAHSAFSEEADQLEPLGGGAGKHAFS